MPHWKDPFTIYQDQDHTSWPFISQSSQASLFALELELDLNKDVKTTLIILDQKGSNTPYGKPSMRSSSTQG